jgi:hypothetical protein
MSGEWLQYATLRVASLLTPRDERDEWLAEWRSELWYIPRRGATLFCLGSFRDALWLRRNTVNPDKRSGIHLDSPLTCLAFLGTLAVAGTLIALRLLGPLATRTTLLRLEPHDLPAGCMMTLVLSCVLLSTAPGAARTPAHCHAMPWPSRLRRGIFLGLKIMLVQPAMLCGLFVCILLAPVAPIAPLGICAAWILTLRWVVTDQQRRCPACLRLLTNPVRIGSSSHTFLEWSGDESLCSRGHGLLHVPEISASYSGAARWVNLDDSWRVLFSEVAGIRQR